MIQIAWCDRCEKMSYGPVGKRAVCPLCHGNDKIKRANLSAKASAIFLKVIKTWERRIENPSGGRLVKLPGEV